MAAKIPPVWFECTDISKAGKPFLTDAWKKITYTSPNLRELEKMYSYVVGKSSGAGDPKNCQEKIEMILALCQTLVHYIPNIITTMGENGLMVCRNTDSHEPFPLRGKPVVKSNGMTALYYPACSPDKQPQVVSVSGAGDCLNAAVLCGILENRTPDACIKMGLKAAIQTLNDHHPVSDKLVPADFTPEEVTAWAPWMAVQHQLRIKDSGLTASFS